MGTKPAALLAALAAAVLIALGGASLTSAAKPTPTPSPQPPTAPPTPAGLRAGLRASDYGIRPWPSPAWWGSSIGSMAARFPGATGAMVAVVVEIDGLTGPGCWAHFPNPDGETYPGVRFDAADKFEPDFARFDEAGIKVWLQVEPAGCDMAMLIDLVMKQYGRHPSVIGFGVDDEWYLNRQYRGGKPITDAEAQAWVALTRSCNTAYRVFLKHWLTAQMPPTYRDGIVFIDDSQGFQSMTAMLAEFATWGSHFGPAPVGFQFGYKTDQKSWARLADPPKTVGNGILARVANTSDLYWVDFTARSIWP
ncbi:MAG TPA: hypothetical protein VJ506_07540 [Candidatus Limnocylindrales bacterium]|nr:hypothetical protein [Candidatus Limnocylindrales bacterium]